MITDVEGAKGGPQLGTICLVVLGWPFPIVDPAVLGCPSYERDKGISELEDRHFKLKTSNQPKMHIFGLAGGSFFSVDATPLDIFNIANWKIHGPFMAHYGPFMVDKHEGLPFSWWLSRSRHWSQSECPSEPGASCARTARLWRDVAEAFSQGHSADVSGQVLGVQCFKTAVTRISWDLHSRKKTHHFLATLLALLALLIVFADSPVLGVAVPVRIGSRTTATGAIYQF